MLILKKCTLEPLHSFPYFSYVTSLLRKTFSSTIIVLFPYPEVIMHVNKYVVNHQQFIHLHILNTLPLRQLVLAGEYNGILLLSPGFISSAFCLKNSKASTFSGDKEALNLEAMWLAAENILSEGTNVADIHRNFLDNMLKKG